MSFKIDIITTLATVVLIGSTASLYIKTKYFQK